MQPRACRGEADLGAWQVSLPGVSPCARPRVGVLRGQHLLTGSEQTSCRPGPEGPLSRPTSSVPLRTRSGAGSGAQGVCSQRCRARPRRPRVWHAPSPCVGPSRGLREVQGPSSGGADHTQGRAQSRAQGHRVPRGPGARPPPRTSIPHSPAPTRSCLGPGRRESPAPVPSVCRVCPKQVSGQVPGAHFLSPEIGPRVLCGWAGWTPDQARLCSGTPQSGRDSWWEGSGEERRPGGGLSPALPTGPTEVARSRPTQVPPRVPVRWEYPLCPCTDRKERLREAGHAPGSPCACLVASGTCQLHRGSQGWRGWREEQGTGRFGPTPGPPRVLGRVGVCRPPT